MKYKKSIVIVSILGIVILFGVFFLFTTKVTQKDGRPIGDKHIKTFAEKEICQKESERPCRFVMCDYVPTGKTFEETCGKDFKKGWSPIERYFPDIYITRIALGMSGDLSESDLSIEKDLTFLYRDKSRQTGEEVRNSGKISQAQFDALYQMIESTDFFLMKEEYPYNPHNPTDAPSYSITVDAEPNVGEHTVSCYYYDCPRDFMKLVNQIEQYAK